MSGLGNSYDALQGAIGLLKNNMDCRAVHPTAYLGSRRVGSVVAVHAHTLQDVNEWLDPSIGYRSSRSRLFTHKNKNSDFDNEMEWHEAAEESAFRTDKHKNKTKQPVKPVLTR